MDMTQKYNDNLIIIFLLEYHCAYLLQEMLLYELFGEFLVFI